MSLEALAGLLGFSQGERFLSARKRLCSFQLELERDQGVLRSGDVLFESVDECGEGICGFHGALSFSVLSGIAQWCNNNIIVYGSNRGMYVLTRRY